MSSVFNISFRRIAPGLLALGVVIFLAACATGSGTDFKQFTHIISHRAGFLKEGPQQTSPPDRYLEEGTRVHLMQHYDTYVQVELTNGEIGWVPSADVDDAPPE